MPPNRRKDVEFGVPFPGQVVDSSRWTQTALKSMPVEGRLQWQELFGRSAPVVVDIGCGNGRFLIGSALTRSTHDHLGIDVLPMVIRYARKRGNQRGLPNLKFAVLGGYELLDKFIEPRSVTEIHCYHPQPFYDAQFYHKRLITPMFLSLVHRCLAPSGTFTIQTDHPAYWSYMQQIIPAFFDFRERIGRWQDTPRGRTRREIIAMKKNLPVFRGVGSPKPLDDSAIDALVATLPAPTFNADRRAIDEEFDD